MSWKRVSLLLAAGALLAVGSAFAQQDDPVQNYVTDLTIPEIKEGELYFRSSIQPSSEPGPVDMPDTPAAPIIRPLGFRGNGVPLAPAAATPGSSSLAFTGGALPSATAGSSSFRDPVRDTERRLKRLIRDLDG